MLTRHYFLSLIKMEIRVRVIRGYFMMSRA